MQNAKQTRAPDVNDPLLNLQQRPYLDGRHYAVLRSGWAQLVFQADTVDLGPAQTWMAFDARYSAQSIRKSNAFNWDRGKGLHLSATTILIGDWPFTAVGHNASMQWIRNDPNGAALLLQWWAGGFQIRETWSTLAEAGWFSHHIQIRNRDMAGVDRACLRLHLPGEPLPSPDSPGMTTRNGAHFWQLQPLSPEFPQATRNGNHWSLSSPPLEPGESCSLHLARGILEETPAPGGRSSFPAAPNRPAPALHIQGGDPLIQSLALKVTAGLPGMIAEDGTMNAGIFEYGRQWVRDTANTALGALHLGYASLSSGAIERIFEDMVDSSGTTMVANTFENPDLEQFDQMGEVLHLLRCHRDWTGDSSLIRRYREKILCLVERPLQPIFRDNTGMVHNRREFWERTFTDGYELAYQIYLILGLREAATLAGDLGVPEKREVWLEEADRVLHAMLHHPRFALVHEGRLLKRRDRDGNPTFLVDRNPKAVSDSPSATETVHALDPDATMALPFALGILSPDHPLARATLDRLELLKNARWSGGGYERYHSSSQIDQPGPWTFATAFILRAQHEAGRFEECRENLAWLDSSAGGPTGTWFEEIPINRSQMQKCGLLPWTSAEIALFLVRHYLGIHFQEGKMVLRPRIFQGTEALQAEIPFPHGTLLLQFDSSGPFQRAYLEGRALPSPIPGQFEMPNGIRTGTVRFQ